MTVLRFILILEGKGTTVCDNTQVILKILFGHPNPCVCNRQCAVFLINRQLNIIIFFVKYQLIIS
ncbi:hypothetical protein D3C77_701090 [compost metagenome]